MSSYFKDVRVEMKNTFVSTRSIDFIDGSNYIKHNINIYTLL